MAEIAGGMGGVVAAPDEAGGGTVLPTPGGSGAEGANGGAIEASLPANAEGANGGAWPAAVVPAPAEPTEKPGAAPGCGSEMLGGPAAHSSEAPGGGGPGAGLLLIVV